MDMLDKLKACNDIKKFINTSNYYFENHNCTKTGNNIKVQLNFTLSNDIDDNILRFGICPECGICFYHKDFQSKSW